MVENLRRLGDLAGAIGIDLAVETHKGPTQNADAMLALMAEVDHPRVRLNFDTGNIAYYNDGADPVAELDRVKHLVRSVHLKDNRGGFEDWYFPALGDGGAVDFRRVREILDGVGFLGPYTIEIEGIGGEPEPGPKPGKTASTGASSPPSRPRLFRGYWGGLRAGHDFPRPDHELPPRLPPARLDPHRSARAGGIEVPLGEMEAGATYRVEVGLEGPIGTRDRARVVVLDGPGGPARSRRSSTPAIPTSTSPIARPSAARPRSSSR